MARCEAVSGCNCGPAQRVSSDTFHVNLSCIHGMVSCHTAKERLAMIITDHLDEVEREHGPEEVDRRVAAALAVKPRSWFARQWHRVFPAPRPAHGEDKG